MPVIYSMSRKRKEVSSTSRRIQTTKKAAQGDEILISFRRHGSDDDCYCTDSDDCTLPTLDYDEYPDGTHPRTKRWDEFSEDFQWKILSGIRAYMYDKELSIDLCEPFMEIGWQLVRCFRMCMNRKKITFHAEFFKELYRYIWPETQSAAVYSVRWGPDHNYTLIATGWCSHYVVKKQAIPELEYKAGDCHAFFKARDCESSSFLSRPRIPCQLFLVHADSIKEPNLTGLRDIIHIREEKPGGDEVRIAHVNSTSCLSTSNQWSPWLSQMAWKYGGCTDNNFPSPGYPTDPFDSFFVDEDDYDHDSS